MYNQLHSASVRPVANPTSPMDAHVHDPSLQEKGIAYSSGRVCMRAFLMIRVESDRKVDVRRAFCM
jgi:hypothetical protein